MKKYLVSIKDGKTLTIEADRMNIEKGVLILYKCSGVTGLFSLDEIKYVIDEKGSKISYSDKGIHLGTFTWDAEKLAVTIQSAKDNVPNL